MGLSNASNRVRHWVKMFFIALFSFAAVTLAKAEDSNEQSTEYSAAAISSSPRPNIIFILTDDQRFDALGLVNPNLQTPNMDKLAREGAFFANAFVTTSICSPSRASFLTGLPMREHGVVDNNSALPAHLATFPMALQNSGYETALIGKWHMGGENDAPRSGFDRWVSFAGQGNYLPKSPLGEPSKLNVDGKTVLQKDYITDELTDYALDWLSSRDSEKPFMLYLSHKASHALFEAADRHEDHYTDLEFENAIPPVESMKNAPLWVQNQRNSWHGVDFPYHSTVELDAFQRDYHRTLLAVDESLGRLMAWLKESGQAENTIVIFTSDNGFLFGEHGLIDKRNAYEPSMRIPFILWGPGLGVTPKRVSQNITSLDVKPTMLALAGLSRESELTGRDLMPLARGDEMTRQTWGQSIVYEYFWEFNYPQTPTMFALRDERYKYIRYHGVWDTDELYDLANDPFEMDNLIDDPELLERRIAMQKLLHASIANSKGEHVVPYTYKFNQGAVFRHPDRSEAAEFPDKWMRQDDAVDRFEHAIPDGPDKAKILEQITKALSAQEE